MTDKKLSIDDLYTDAGTFDEQEVLRTLQDRVVFTKDNDILFTTDPDKLQARDVILLYALAKQMLRSADKVDSQIITNAEVQHKTKLKKTTVGVTIMRLKEKKLLLGADGGYEIPPFKIPEVIKLLNSDTSK